LDSRWKIEWTDEFKRDYQSSEITLE